MWAGGWYGSNNSYKHWYEKPLIISKNKINLWVFS